MVLFQDIVKDLSAVKVCSENMYSIMSLQKAISRMEDQITVSEDGLWLVPFYTSEGKLMEFYWMKLQIFDKTEETIQERILASTGARCISDVEAWVIDLYERTHVDVIPPERVVPTQILLRYLNEILNNQEIKELALKHFGTYSSHNIMFTMY